MRKLLLRLATITLLASPVTSIVSCSTKPGKSSSGDVKFDKSKYSVLKGQVLSVNISNFSSISAKGFAGSVAVGSSDQSIAAYKAKAKDDDNSSIEIGGTKKGTVTITATFTNLSTQEIMQGTFIIQVLDFSDTSIDWDGSQSSPIDIYTSGSSIIFGKIKNFSTFKDSDYDFDYTSSTNFKVTLNDPADTTHGSLTNYIDPTSGTVDSSGQICFKLRTTEVPDAATWDGKNPVTVTVSSDTLGIKGVTSGDIYVGRFAGGTSVSATTHELNFQKPDSSSLKDYTDGTTFKKNSNGTYTITYKLDAGNTEITKDTFDDQSAFVLGSDKISKVTGALTGTNEYSVTMSLNSSASFNSFNMTVYFVFNLKESALKSNSDDDDDKGRKYTGTLVQPFSDYLLSVSGIDGQKIGKVSAIKTPIDTYSINTDEYSPITMSYSISDAGKLPAKSGYSFSDSIVVASDDPILDKLNPDPKDPTNGDRITKEDIYGDDSEGGTPGVTDISKDGKTLPFDINSISIVGANLLINGTGAIRTSSTTSMTVLIIFKDSNGNILVESADITFSEVDSIGYSSIIDASAIAQGFVIHDSADTSKIINLHDGLSESTGLEMAYDDKEIKLKLNQTDGSGDAKIDYSTWKVAISGGSNLIKAGSNPIDKDGNVKLTQVGQGNKNVANNSVTITLSDSKNSVSVVLYTSAYIGQESGNYDVSKLISDADASITVSTKLKSTSLITTETLNGVIEYNNDAGDDGFQYNANRAVVALNSAPLGTDITNYVVFDGKINIKAPDVINTGYYSGYSKKIIFNGDVNFQAQTTGTLKSSYGCGILNTNVNDIEGFFTDGASFNGKVNVTTSTGESDTSLYGVGVITTGATSAIGSRIHFNNSIKVDSSNWNSKSNGCAATGLLVAVKSFFSYYPETSNFSIDTVVGDTNGTLDIEGKYSKTKAIIDDYAGYINKTKATKTYKNLTTIYYSVTLGETDSSILEQNSAYGNAAYSRINGTGATSGSADAYIGNILLPDQKRYLDKDAKDDNNRSIVKIAGAIDGDIGAIGFRTTAVTKDNILLSIKDKLMGTYDPSSSTATIIKYSDGGSWDSK